MTVDLEKDKEFFAFAWTMLKGEEGLFLAIYLWISIAVLSVPVLGVLFFLADLIAQGLTQ
jgi:hypothetical protein